MPEMSILLGLFIGYSLTAIYLGLMNSNFYFDVKKMGDTKKYPYPLNWFRVFLGGPAIWLIMLLAILFGHILFFSVKDNENETD